MQVAITFIWWKSYFHKHDSSCQIKWLGCDERPLDAQKVLIDVAIQRVGGRAEVTNQQ